MIAYWWKTKLVPLILDVAAAAADDRSAHKIDMSDPKQDMDFNVGTPLDQLRLAINTIETELQNPDGVSMSADDVAEAQQALQALRMVVDRVETKSAGYMAEHREKPRSDRA